MNRIRKALFGDLLDEFGDAAAPVIRKVLSALGADASEKVARDAVRREVRTAPSQKKVTQQAATPPKPKEKPLAARPTAPAVISARSGSPAAAAQDVLREAQKPSKGALSYADWRAQNPETGVLFDTSNLSAVPDVPQVQMERVVPSRGAPPRIVEALADPEVERGINETVMRGIEGGGKEWYNTEPMRQRMLGLVPDADASYAQLMDIMAATSPRARVPDNIRTGSYYNYLRSQGQPIPDRPAPGYGSIAQTLHRENVRGLEERGGWDIFKNPKPASFSTNLQGNQRNVTIDTHNFRLPGILARDPRFLETSIAELAKTPESALETLRRQYPNLPEEVVAASVNEKPGKVSITYRPQEWVNKGYISMDEAVNDPALWASKPRDNEYGFYEAWQQDQAEKLGVSPAQYQAAMWLGGGETTGLASASEPFVGTFEARVRYTADRLGMNPDQVLEMMLKGEMPLLAEGGAVDHEDLAVKRERKALSVKKKRKRG